MAPYQQFEMANPRLDTPMMMNPPDEMLAIETHEGHPPRSNSYPALMNGINHATSSAMTPYNTPKSSIIVPASNNKSMMNPNPGINSNNFPPLDYAQHAALMNGQKYYPGMGNMDQNPVGKNRPLPSILPPNHGAVQPYINGINHDSEDENDEKLELEYQGQNNQLDIMNNKKQKDLVQENNKKNETAEKVTNGGVTSEQKPNTTNSTISNNGTIKVAIATEISMANMMNNFHQCKWSDEIVKKFIDEIWLREVLKKNFRRRPMTDGAVFVVKILMLPSTPDQFLNPIL